MRNITAGAVQNSPAYHRRWTIESTNNTNGLNPGKILASIGGSGPPIASKPAATNISPRTVQRIIPLALPKSFNNSYVYETSIL